MLCGVAPLPASSGLTQRHRINRGGDRQANSALHPAVISRIRMDPRTQAYMVRKTAEGHSKLEVVRCLKHYLAREAYYLLNPGKAAVTRTTARDLTLLRHPRETLTLLETGLTDRDVAAQRQLSPRTIEDHKRKSVRSSALA